VYEDLAQKNRPPEEFYSFVRFRKSTRQKLILNNKDLFIATGQNGFFAVLVILTYALVWLLKLGKREWKGFKIIIKIQRIML
jgi:hypothetical protein